MKKDNNKLDAKYVTVEKVSNGFLVILPSSKKTFKSTLNGVLTFLEEAFETKRINIPKKELSDQKIGKGPKCLQQKK